MLIEALNGAGNGVGVERLTREIVQGALERGGGLLRKEEAIDLGLDEIATAALLISNNGATSGEGLNGSNAKGLEAGKEVGASILEIAGEVEGGEPREKGDERGIIRDGVRIGEDDGALM